MSQQRVSNKINRSRLRGFTLIEVLVSIAILSIGLLSVGALIASTMNTGTNSKFINMANTLASEKLDTLSKWPSTDPNVAAGGALTGPATCVAGDDYCDQVTMSESSGANYETQTQIVSGNPVTTTIVQTNTGCVDTPANCGVANPTGGGYLYATVADYIAGDGDFRWGHGYYRGDSRHGSEANHRPRGLEQSASSTARLIPVEHGPPLRLLSRKRVSGNDFMGKWRVTAPAAIGPKKAQQMPAPCRQIALASQDLSPSFGRATSNCK
jgi:type IV pilus modification protein PilV